MKGLGRWFWAKLVIVLFAVADIVADWQFTSFLMSERPTSPVGQFTVAFEQHGGVNYITLADHWTNIALIAGGALIVLAYWLIGHFEKRSRTR